MKNTYLIASEGAIDMRGAYDGYYYEISFSYPILGQLTSSLEEWVAQILERFPADQRAAVTDTVIAGAGAKIAFNFPVDAAGDVTAQAYIWQHDGKNPRQISIKQVDSEPNDPQRMESLFAQFLAGVN